MTILAQACQKTGKTAYQIFYLAYLAKADGEEGEEELEGRVQNMFRFSQDSEIVPHTVYSFCLDIITERRKV